MWSKAKSSSKVGFDYVYGWVDKLGAPVNKLSNKVGAEAFWPTTLDKESDKAARILRSFCKDGFYQEEVQQSPDGPKQKQKVIKKIPSEVIKNAKGLAIFTVMRTGLWFSGAGGAGILVAKLPDGSWSPPSGLMLHTAGLGFLVGVDIYDCVMVINTEEALQGFSKLRATVGGEMSAVAGPVGIGGVLESEVHARRAPIFTYLKSRGFYAGVQIDGTVLIERMDENEKFYGEKIGVADILSGKVKDPPASIGSLMRTIRAAQGESVPDSELPQEAPPGDFEIQDDGHLFGVPDKMDPDPYGVLALEKEGLVVKEAGTHKRASHEAFTFSPSPSSPVFSNYNNRNSADVRASLSRRTSWRTSIATTIASRPASTMMDTSTQTAVDTPATTPDSPGSTSTRKMADIKEDVQADKTQTDGASPLPAESVTSGGHVRHESYPTEPEIRIDEQVDAIPETEEHEIEEKAEDTEEGDAISDHEDSEEPVIVHTIQTAASPQFVNRVRLVSVKKPATPSLPPRNPYRGKPLVIGGTPRSDSSQDEEHPARSSLEHTTSNDSMTSVDLADKLPSSEHKESDEFHSAAQSPKILPVDAESTPAHAASLSTNS